MLIDDFAGLCVTVGTGCFALGLLAVLFPAVLFPAVLFPAVVFFGVGFFGVGFFGVVFFGVAVFGAGPGPAAAGFSAATACSGAAVLAAVLAVALFGVVLFGVVAVAAVGFAMAGFAVALLAVVGFAAAGFAGGFCFAAAGSTAGTTRFAGALLAADAGLRAGLMSPLDCLAAGRFETAGSGAVGDAFLTARWPVVAARTAAFFAGGRVAAGRRSASGAWRGPVWDGITARGDTALPERAPRLVGAESADTAATFGPRSSGR